MADKLKSRKFWMAALAFLGSVAASIQGLNTDNETVAAVGIVCGMLSAAMYAAAEAYVDAASASANGTAKTVTATTSSAKVVSALTGASAEAAKADGAAE